MTAKRSAKAKGWREDRYRHLIEQLVAERKSLGLSQEALAARLDRQQHYISRYETGERRLDVAEFADVAVALGLAPGELIRELWPG
jgi:transcriptional regulator with XRE-family HTH domain